jgi:HemY protein
MIRLVLFLLSVLAAAAGLHWLADRPGSLVVDWQGYVLETSVFRAAIIFAALVALGVLGWSLLRGVWRTPGVIGQLVTQRRERRGLDAISSGMIAIGSGDRASATRAAVLARKSLPNEPLTHLLRAQAAQLQGDSATSRRIFEAMLASPDTEQLGLRGLFLEAQRVGEEIAATQFAERALKLNPKLEWPASALFDLQCKQANWDGALDTLAIARKHGHIERKVADRRRAVLLTAQAQALEEMQGDRAAELAFEAHGLAPDLVPAAAIAGRVYAARGQTPKAAKVLQRAWKAAPHPEIAAAYAFARPGDSPSDRVDRVRQLVKSTPGSVEGAIALATTAAESRDWDTARAALEPFVSKELTQRICTLMARIEGEGFQNAGRAREWLARAVHAGRDPVWTADGVMSEQWAPTSPVTGALDAFEWKVPVELLDKPESALVTARMDALIRLGVEPALPSASEGVRSNDDGAEVIEAIEVVSGMQSRRTTGGGAQDADVITSPATPVDQRRPRSGEGQMSAAAVPTSGSNRSGDGSAFINGAPDDPGVARDETDAKTKLERYRLIGAKT